MEKLANKVYTYPFTEDHVSTRTFKVLKKDIFPPGKKGNVEVGDQVLLNITSSGKLQVIDCRFNEDEVYLILGAEAKIEPKPLPVVVLVTVPKTWKPGDKLEDFYGLEAVL